VENFLLIKTFQIELENSQYMLNRVVVPYEISKVNFRAETKMLVSMSEEI
jgi:hypothetical protein